MKKVINALFGENRVFITINAFFVLVMLIYFVFDVYLLDFWLFIAFYAINYEDIVFGIPEIIIPVLVIINTLAFFAVKNNKKSGIVFSVLLGSAGGFLALYTVNKDYFAAKAIKIIFNITFWIIVVIPRIVIMDYWLYIVGIVYALFIVFAFLFSINLSRCVPLEKLITVNFSFNAVWFVLNAFLFETIIDCVYSNVSCRWPFPQEIFITAVGFIIAFLPNLVLYLIYRKKEKTNYNLKKHLCKALMICIFNFQAIYLIGFIISIPRMYFMLSYDC